MVISRKQFVQSGVASAAALWGSFAFCAPARRQGSYLDVTWWDPYVEKITDVDTYLRRKFRQDVTDKATGLSQEALAKRLAAIVAEAKASGESWRVTKAKCFAAQVLEESRFKAQLVRNLAVAAGIWALVMATLSKMAWVAS